MVRTDYLLRHFYKRAAAPDMFHEYIQQITSIFIFTKINQICSAAAPRSAVILQTALGCRSVRLWVFSLARMQQYREYIDNRFVVNRLRYKGGIIKTLLTNCGFVQHIFIDDIITLWPKLGNIWNWKWYKILTPPLNWIKDFI